LLEAAELQSNREMAFPFCGWLFVAVEHNSKTGYGPLDKRVLLLEKRFKASSVELA
jgi:hypothetical protein